jgi:membrane protease YdiL (CAAX protease family)
MPNEHPAESIDKKSRRITSIILIGMSIIMFSPIIQNIAVGFKNPFFYNMGFDHNSVAPFYIWIISLIITIGYLAYTFRAIPLVFKKQREISVFKIIGLCSGLIAGIIEELLFRRWLMDFTMNNGIGIILQITISGVSFGIFHAAWSLPGGNIKFGLKASLSTTVLGLSLATLYIIGQRNIGPCIVSHCIISMTIEPWLLLAAVSKTRY